MDLKYIEDLIQNCEWVPEDGHGRFKLKFENGVRIYNGDYKNSTDSKKDHKYFIEESQKGEWLLKFGQSQQIIGAINEKYIFLKGNTGWEILERKPKQNL